MTKNEEENLFILKLKEAKYSYADITKRFEERYGQSISKDAAQARVRRMRKQESISINTEDIPDNKGAWSPYKTGESWFKIGILDTETTGLWADFGYVLVAVVKDSGTGKYEILRLDEMPSYANKNLKRPEFWKGGVDRELLIRLRKIYEQYDIVFHFNGRYFDIKFLNTRMIKSGIPILPEMKQVDVLQLAWSKLRTRFKRLDALREFLGLTTDEGKGHKWEYWQMAANGQKAGFDYVVEHCKDDVDNLEQAAYKLKGFITYIRT